MNNLLLYGHVKLYYTIYIDLHIHGNHCSNISNIQSIKCFSLSIYIYVSIYIIYDY